MFFQLSLGAAVIVGTVLIQVGFFACISAMLEKLGNWIVRDNTSLKFIIVLSSLILWLVAGLTACAWLWASVFLIFDVFAVLEQALYFSVVTFTTLGYGDVTLNDNWRLLGSLCAVNGLIIVGLNTAFLVEALSQIRAGQEKLK